MPVGYCLFYNLYNSNNRINRRLVFLRLSLLVVGYLYKDKNYHFFFKFFNNIVIIPTLTKTPIPIIK